MHGSLSFPALFFLLLLAPPAVFAEDKAEDKAEGNAENQATDKSKEEFETDPQVIEDDIERITDEYKAIKSNQDLDQTRRRRELARRLGRLPHKDAIKMLLQIVENDSDVRARIVAMHSLCRIGDIKAINRMYKAVLKDRKDVLGYYLGSALAGARDPDIGAWIIARPLKRGGKGPIRQNAVMALGDLRVGAARVPLLEFYEKEAKRSHPDIHLYYELIRALGKIGGDGVWSILERSARNTDWRVRLAVAEVLPIRFRSDRAIALIRDLLKDEKQIVRELAAVSAGKAKLEPVFPQLVLLMREGNLRSKHKAFEAMKRISGQDYGYAPDAWDKWLSEKKKGKLTEEGDITNRETLSVGSYYDFKIFSDRVLFVVDVSGSMNWPEWTPNRIEVARTELIKAVQSLDEKTLFNVATFAGHVNFWRKDGEIAATDKNKRKVLKWIERNLLPRGATNTYDALIRSLELNPLVDTVFFLSDGIPSTGRFELPEKILVELRYHNRFRKVIFNTIAIAMGKPSIDKAIKYEDPEEMAAFMRMISDMTGGTCVDIRKPPIRR